MNATRQWKEIIKMSVSLDEVLTAAGYDIKNNPEDAQWLLAQRDEFEDLCNIADETIDEYETKLNDEDYWNDGRRNTKYH